RGAARQLFGAPDEDLDLSLLLSLDGTKGNVIVTSQHWTGALTDYFVERTPAEWGFPALTPADVCGGQLAVTLQVLANGTFGNVLTPLAGVDVDFVALEITGAPDCDDGDADAFSPLDVYEDADGDGHRADVLLGTCAGEALLLAPRGLEP